MILLFIVVIAPYLDLPWLHHSILLLSRPMMGHHTLIWASNACFVALFVLLFKLIYVSQLLRKEILINLGSTVTFVGHHAQLDPFIMGVIEGSLFNISSASTRWVQICISAASSKTMPTCISNSSWFESRPYSFMSLLFFWSGSWFLLLRLNNKLNSIKIDAKRSRFQV